MISRTIGATGQHVDVAAWTSYVQSNHVSGGNLTDDQSGGVIAAGLSVSTPQIISGWAPGPSGYSTTLTYDPASAGAAWFGQNCRSNSYVYNTARGAFISSTYNPGSPTGAITWRVNKNRTIGLMVKATGGYIRALSYDTTAMDDVLVEGCYTWATSEVDGVVHFASNVDGPSVIVRNTVSQSDRGASGSTALQSQGNSTFANRIRLHDNIFWQGGGSNNNIVGMAGTVYVETIGNVYLGSPNCALAARDAQTNGSHNAIERAAFNNTPYGAGTITGLTNTAASITAANEFTGVANLGGSAPTDFRLKAGGTALQGTGTTISGITTDATGFTRSAGFEDRGSYQLTTGGGGGTNVNLTGQGMSFNQGAVALAVNKALTGQSANANQGSVTSGVTIPISGQGLTSVQGSLAYTVEKLLTGQAATVGQGALTTNTGGTPINVNLTGQSMTAGQGALAYTVEKLLTGQAATANQGPLTLSVSKSITGQSMAAGQGSITKEVAKSITGQGMTAAQGSISKTINKILTGQAATAQQGALYIGALPTIISIPGQSAAVLQGIITPGVTKGLLGQATMSMSQGILTFVITADIVREIDYESLIVPYEYRYMTVAAREAMTVRAEENMLYVLRDDEDPVATKGQG